MLPHAAARCTTRRSARPSATMFSASLSLPTKSSLRPISATAARTMKSSRSETRAVASPSSAPPSPEPPSPAPPSATPSSSRTSSRRILRCPTTQPPRENCATFSPSSPAVASISFSPALARRMSLPLKLLSFPRASTHRPNLSQPRPRTLAGPMSGTITAPARLPCTTTPPLSASSPAQQQPTSLEAVPATSPTQRLNLQRSRPVPPSFPELSSPAAPPTRGKRRLQSLRLTTPSERTHITKSENRQKSRSTAKEPDQLQLNPERPTPPLALLRLMPHQPPIPDASRSTPLSRPLQASHAL